MALIKCIIVGVSLTLILYYLSFSFKFSNYDDDSSPLILNTRESSLLNDEDKKKEEEEWIYLSSMKINFSLAGFSSSAYTKQLKQVLEYYFKNNPIEDQVPIVFWWTPPIHYYDANMISGRYRTCGSEQRQRKCFFTSIRLYRQIYRTHQKAFIFNGLNFKLHDLPLPRRQNDQWALMYGDSPKNNYLLANEKIIRMFNHTATFSRYSDFSLLTQHLTSIEDLESTRFLVSTREKNRLQSEEGLAPVVYIESECQVPTDRDVYVRALMRYLRVDSYGKCLNNRDLPKNITSEELYQLLAKYKFVISMENAVCNDYVTDNLWRSFYVGAIPIVYGSPNIRDLFPDENTAIEILSFRSARELANRLNELNTNDTAYEDYLKYKRKGGVKNELLLKMMAVSKRMGEDEKEFECMVCERVAETVERRGENKSMIRWQARRSHFDCPAPYAFSNEGVPLLDSTRRDYKPSRYLSMFEMEEVKIRVWYEKFILVKRYLVNYKELMYETLRQFNKNNKRLIKDEL